MRRRNIIVLFIIIAIAFAIIFLGKERAPDGDVRHSPRHTSKQEGQRKVSGAMKALNSWAAGRAYPGNAIPDVGHALAFEQTQQMRGRTDAIDVITEPWTNLGPANLGGRTLALALHPENPDIIYAGSAAGGLWRSTTGGVGADAWDRIETGHAVTSVSCITIDPANPDVMYIGTGEVYRYQDSIGGEVIRTTRGSYGVGILKTEDSGLTWTKVLDWSYAQQRGVWAVRLHPQDSQIVWAGTTEGVYKSLNGGGTWTLQLDVVMVTDLQLHPSQPDVLFAACGNLGSAGRGIYRSLDGGANWSQLGGGLPTTFTGKTLLAIAPSDATTIYASMANEGSGYGLYRSTNQGNNWTRINSTDYAQYQGWYAHYVLLSPFDPQTLFTGGIEIWRSTNGGSSLTELSEWQEVYFGTPPPEGPYGGNNYAHADHHAAVWHPSDPSTVFFASDGGVYKTTDLGNNFIGLNGGYVSCQFYNGFSTSAVDPDLAIGGCQDNFTNIYRGTLAWQRVIGGDGCWTAMHPTDPDIMYGSWQNLNMQRSTNDGSNWSYVSPPNSGSTAFVAPFVLCPAEPTTLYAGRNRVYRSENSGGSWTQTNGSVPLNGNNPVLALAVSATSADTAFASTSPIDDRGRVFRTLNRGDSWQDVTGILPDRYPSDLHVDPTNSSFVYATFLGFGSSHVFKSIDAGASWTDIGSTLPDIPTTAVTTDPEHPEVIYVGTDLGVFVSPDGGDTWQTFAVGMPTALVNDLKVQLATRMLRAATHGNGAYERALYEPEATAVADSPFAGVGLRVWPNPLQTGSRVHYDLSRASRVRLSMYDVQGRRVGLLDEGDRGAGAHSLGLESLSLPAGVYFVRLETEQGVQNARVVYLR